VNHARSQVFSSLGTCSDHLTFFESISIRFRSGYRLVPGGAVALIQQLHAYLARLLYRLCPRYYSGTHLLTALRVFRRVPQHTIYTCFHGDRTPISLPAREQKFGRFLHPRKQTTYRQSISQSQRGPHSLSCLFDMTIARHRGFCPPAKRIFAQSLPVSEEAFSILFAPHS
jgi:hypothetical protein